MSGDLLAGRPGAVLIADDNEEVRRVLARFLAGSGREARAAADAEEALAAVRADPSVWALLVVDASLPAMGGLALAERARRHAPGLALLFVTGDGADSAPALAALGPVLEKPFERDDFLAAAGRALAVPPPAAGK